MQEKIWLDNLTQDMVTIKKQKFIFDNGVEYKVGSIWSCTYFNKLIDRQLVNDEVPDPYKSVIMLMWGDTPTVTE